MYLKAKLNQHRRDFQAIYACQECGWEHEDYGYDDLNFHHNVIPNMTCKECGTKGGGRITDPTIPPHVTL